MYVVTIDSFIKAEIILSYINRYIPHFIHLCITGCSCHRRIFAVINIVIDKFCFIGDVYCRIARSYTKF